MKRVPAILSITLVLTGAVLTANAAPISTVALASANSAGTGSGNSPAGLSRVSPNGRYLIFSSRASNLVPGDLNGTTDVFVRDLVTGKTVLASMNAAGTGSGNGASTDAQISADGRYAVFESNASDLVPNDTNGAGLDVFARDLATGKTILVSANSAGNGSGNGESFDAVICLDGSTVAFESKASNLVPNDTNGLSDVFLRKLSTGTIAKASTDSTGTVNANGISWDPVMSQDGQVVTFESNASNLVAGDKNGTQDIYVRNMATGATALVSLNLAKTGAGNSSSFDPSISMDGKRVVFCSWASNLVSTDTNTQRDIFMRDLVGGTTTLVTINRLGTDSGNGDAPHAARISADGSTVAFTSTSTDLVANDTNGVIEDVFVRNLAAKTTALVSVNSTGTGSGNGASAVDVFPSADGRYIAFDSEASDLVPNDANGDNDIFVRDVRGGATTLASASISGGSGSGFSFDPHISLSGRFVSFDSGASDLVARDGNFAQDVFVSLINTAPTAANDGYAVKKNTALVVPVATGVLKNDGDADGDALTAVLEAPPLQGTVTLNADGSFRYTPATGFIGFDTFTYRAADGAAGSLPATVTLSVDPPAQLPVANAGPDQTVEGKGATTPVTMDGSASTAPGGVTLTYEWYEGATLIGTGVKPVVNLTLGAHAVVLKVKAPSGAGSTDSVAVTIVDRTAPTITNLVVTPSVLTADTFAHKVNVTYTLTDLCDPNPTAELDATSNEPATRPDVVDPSDQSTPDISIVDSHFVWLRGEYSTRGTGRVYTITVTCKDASGNTASKTVTVTVPKPAAVAKKAATVKKAAPKKAKKPAPAKKRAAPKKMKK